MMVNDGINDGINNGISWLVVGNMIFSTHTYIYILIENNDPTDELIFFRGVGIPPTSMCGINL